MNHALKIVLGKKKQNGGIVACRRLTVRERLLRFLLGSPVRLTVLVPGDSVEELEICERRNGGAPVEAV